MNSLRSYIPKPRSLTNSGLALLFLLFSIPSCLSSNSTRSEKGSKSNVPISEQPFEDPTTTAEQNTIPGSTTVQTAIGPLTLPPPYATESAVKLSDIKGWDKGQTPIAPAGFTLRRLAEDLKHPRWAYVGPNGDIFIAESNKRSSADRITMFREDLETGEVGRFDFLEDLNSPLGMLILDDYFYVANMDAVVRYPYTPGMDRIDGEGEKLIDLPAGGYNNHWTRNIVSSADGQHIYVSVGSASNVGEHGMDVEQRRACILRIRPDGSGEELFASGIRNPVGMDWNPVTGELWTAVNERDELGDDLVPDYITSVKEGGFYGWPYSYFGRIPDPRWEQEPHQELVDKSIIPDVAVGSHTASLGLCFYTGDSFPEKYRNGAFVGQHGSWNRADFAGYRVLFVPFMDGRPQTPVDFLTGFIADEGDNDVFGRPVGVAQTADGSLLVVDDAADIVWKVSVEKE